MQWFAVFRAKLCLLRTRGMWVVPAVCLLFSYEHESTNHMAYNCIFTVTAQAKASFFGFKVVSLQPHVHVARCHGSTAAIKIMPKRGRSGCMAEISLWCWFHRDFAARGFACRSLFAAPIHWHQMAWPMLQSLGVRRFHSADLFGICLKGNATNRCGTFTPASCWFPLYFFCFSCSLVHIILME